MGRRVKQKELPFVEWGGRRRNAGRPPNNGVAGESHLKREPLASRYPVHTNIKVSAGLPSLRQKAERGVLIEAFRKGAERFGFRMVHYAIMRNHLHFIVEAKNREALSRGMQGLLIRVARGLNKLWGRSGKVFADRYHDTILKSPTQVRNTLVYVLQNAKKHIRRLSTALDHYASGFWFDGWRDPITHPCGTPEQPTARARTWLLNVGWRKRGLISLTEAPAAPPA